MSKNIQNKKESTKTNSMAQVFQGVLSEIKRVQWPTWGKTQEMLASVFFVLIMFSLVIWLIDSSVFGFLNFLGFFN